MEIETEIKKNLNGSDFFSHLLLVRILYNELQFDHIQHSLPS